jgi:hypothetical protein
LPNSIVYITGNQIISGNKTFINNISVSGTGNFNNVKVSSIDNLFLSGIDIVITGNSSINVYNQIYISGNRVLTGIIPSSQTITNVVYTTGDQTISGTKIFASPIVFSSGANDGIYLGGAGGSINLRGANSFNSSPGSNGGNILTYGGLNGGSHGGSITTIGGRYDNTAGGDINTSGGEGPGGSINTSNGGGSIDTSGNPDWSKVGGSITTKAGIAPNPVFDGSPGDGGLIDTSGGNSSHDGDDNPINGKDGGSIITANGGGSIDTRNQGSIQLGFQGQRTTLNGSAAGDKTIILPNANGTLALDSNVAITGSILNNKINSLSGYVNSQDLIFSGQAFNTGSRLDTKINSLSGYLNSQDIIFSGQTASTGSNLNNKINSLSGYVNSQDNLFSGQIALTGSILDNKINSLSGYVNAQSTSGQVFNTGSTLDNKINALSGYVNSQDVIFSGQTFNTGSRLDSKINSLSGYVDSKSITLPTTIVYTTGNQTISGNKTFVENVTFGDQAQDNLFVVSGNEVSFGVYPTINGTGIVYTEGNQTISGRKIFERIDIKAPDGQLVGYISGESLEGSYQRLIINGFGGPDEQSVIIQSAGNSIAFGEAAFSITNGNGVLNFNGGDEIYINGTRNLVGSNISASFKEVSANNLVYNVNDQIISGIKNFASRPTVNGTGVLLSGEAINFTLPNTIVYTTGNQTVSGTKTFANNLEVQGTGIFNALDLSNISEFNFSGTNINLINGNVNISGGTLYISGNAVLTGVDLTSYATVANLFSTGSTLDNKINALSGYFNSQDIIFSGQIASSGSSLYNSIIALSGLFTGYTGSLDANFATDAQLFTTGSVLDNKVNSLSGYVNAQNIVFSGQIFNTGSRLDTKINSLSGVSVLTFGDQTIYGNKNFLNNIGVSGTGVFNAIDLNNVDVLSLSGVDISITNGNVSLTNRPTVNGTGVLLIGEASSTASISGNNFVYTTGDQLISGNKTFLNNVNISGTGNFNAVKISSIDNLFLSGVDIVVTGNSSINVYNQIYISGNPVLTGIIPSSQTLANVVYTTGNQNINGTKTFLDNIAVSGTGNFNNVKVSSIDKLFLSGIDMVITGNSSINVYNAIYISGNPVLTGVIPTNQTITNVVYITGDQTISGSKTFANTGSFNTLQITNKKLSSYNYISSNFTFGDAHINIVNSSNNVIGTLPSSVISGINYYVKNLNTGVLLITGSDQRTIDGFSNINLYKNESLQLLGVNNIGYTGWISLSVSAGVS